MTMNRRNFLRLATAGALLNTRSVDAIAGQAKAAGIKAIAFDGFPILDPRPIASKAEALFPEHGATLMQAWRIRLFQYQWLRALSDQYLDFLKLADHSLTFVAKQLEIELSREKRQSLLSAWENLQVWPDVPDAVEHLREAGLRLAFLSNMTAGMLTRGLDNAGLRDAFEAVISTDRIRTYKPDPRAYALGMQVLQLQKQEILFAAFAGWDVAGAKWFGYPTFWVNRTNSPAEELGVEPDAIGTDLAALVHFSTAKTV